MKLKFSKIVSLFVLLMVSTHGLAHTDIAPKSFVSANAQINFANKGTVEPGQRWIVPGTFMGGEALPMEKGMAIQDLQLQGQWVVRETYSVATRIATHHEGEIELENFYFQFHPYGNFDVAVGKMDAAFSPASVWHAYNDQFNEASLISEVMFGGHFSDTGVQMLSVLNQFTFGIEAWNGSAWPASAGEYSADVFIHFKTDLNNMKVKTGIWALYSEAEQRNDQRYASGHSHSGTITSNALDTIYFSGEEILSGMFVDFRIPIENSTLGFYSEFILKDIEGELNDETRLINFEAEHQVAMSKLYLERGKMTYALRYEVLGFENEFSGLGADFLASDAQLVNNNLEPSRTHVSIARTIDNFIVRAEAVKDASYTDEAISRFTLSLIWQDKLWQQQ